MRARDLRDDVALAVLPTLLSQIARSGETTRRRAVCESFAFADEFMLHRAVDMGGSQDSTLVPNYTDACIKPHRYHLWTEAACLRCGAKTPPHIITRKRYDANRHARLSGPKLVRKEA